MPAMKVGIMPREQFQQRVLNIAAGQYKPKRGEPKVWFNTIKSLSTVLSENNVRLLKITDEQKPETIGALAKLSNRKVPNVSRTLKTMERYGIYPKRLGFRLYCCPISVLAALKFLTIVRLLLVISPCQNKNMTRTKYLNPKRFGHSKASKIQQAYSAVCKGDYI